MGDDLSPRSTVVRRQLGRRLRYLRESAGKRHEDVTEAQIASRSKMWKIETGRVPVSQGDILALTRLYGAAPAVVDELLALAAASRNTGFLESHGSSVPDWVGIFSDLEAFAAEVLIYTSEIVPGILQCPGYARAMIRAGDDSLPQKAVDERLSFRLRLRRQRALFERDRPGRVRTVITEGAWRVRVGSTTVMEEELAHLRAMIDRDLVEVRILPADRGLHDAMRGPFTILLFNDEADPDLAHVESVVGARYFDRPEHVAEFRKAFDRVHSPAVSLEEFVQ
jgi:transcriptional regulator with XRE-family HTH domain